MLISTAQAASSKQHVCTKQGAVSVPWQHVTQPSQDVGGQVPESNGRVVCVWGGVAVMMHSTAAHTRKPQQGVPGSCVVKAVTPAQHACRQKAADGQHCSCHWLNTQLRTSHLHHDVNTTQSSSPAKPQPVRCCARVALLGLGYACAQGVQTASVLQGQSDGHEYACRM
jgi:hypothetical protein